MAHINNRKIEALKKYGASKSGSGVSANHLCPAYMEEMTDPAYLRNITVSEEDVKKYVDRIDQAFTDKNISDLLQDCRQSAINAIIVPLGLGKFIALYDRIGGNVDTIHNARHGVYASEEERAKGDAVQPKSVGKDGRIIEKADNAYDSSKAHSHSNYIEKGREAKRTMQSGELIDDYTGQPLTENRNQDHVVSAREIHEDRGRVLADIDGYDLANKDENFRQTNERINKVKKDKSVSQFLDELPTKIEDTRQRIQNLNNKGELNDNQLKEKANLEKKLAELEKIDSESAERMKAADKEARAAINSEINRTYYTSGKFIKNAAATSATEGMKMGFQQAFGLLCYDLMNALFDEVVDIWRNNLVDSESSGWFEAVRKRLARVADKAASNWRTLLSNSLDGFLSGIISNLVTVLVNTFFTTLKNIVRMIREGAMVLYRAAKSLLFPDKDKNWRESLDDALKVIVAGGLGVGGIALEEIVGAMFVGIPGANILTAICVGLATGILTALAMYALDKLDPFGVKDHKRREAFYAQIYQDEQRLLDFQESLAIS